MDIATEKAQSDVEALTQILDGLPIYATRIGCRTNSTEAEEALMHALFKVHTTWQEVRPR